MADSKWLTGLTAATALVDAARRALSVRLHGVRRYLGLALNESDKDPEHVHQLRVCTRRATAAIEIFALCLPEKAYDLARKHLRRLRRAAGAARDWDVFILSLPSAAANTGRHRNRVFDFLMGYGIAERTHAQVLIAEAGLEYPHGVERLHTEVVAALQKPRYDVGKRTLLDLAGPLLFECFRDLDQAAAENLDDYEHLHRIRIFGKRLRYAMEIFGECFGRAFKHKLYPAVEEMQEILGNANDSYVAGQRLSGICERVKATPGANWKTLKPGLEALIHFYARQLAEQREEFLNWLKRWHKVGGEAAFARLWKVVEPPMS